MIGLASPADIFGRARQVWRPPPRLNLDEWAERNYYLSAESSAEPGRWKTIPYQRGIMRAITDPTIMQVSVMKSARVGYTKIVNATCGYYIDQDPCPIMVVQPTIEDAAGYSKEEIAPMLRDCPRLAQLVPEPKTRDSDNTILAKRFPGGSLTIIGANSARGFRRVSRKVVIFDETDGYPPSAGSEGDQIQLGIRRTEYYWDRKIIAGSTPTDAGRSRIEKLFYAGDQRRFYVPCLHCGEFQVLRFDGIKWPKNKPELAAYYCIHCGAETQHARKFEMVRAAEESQRAGGPGGWQPGPHAQFADAPAPPPFNGHASFHIWAGYSFSPNATWGQLAKEWTEANQRGTEHLKTFINTALGEPWQDRGEAPDWERLYQRRDTYALGTCPLGALFLVCGVDVQKDRLIYEVVGYGREKRSWSIDAGVVPGDTSDLTGRGPWPALEALLNRQFSHEGGRALSIAMLAVDSGFNSQTVYGWARKHPMSRVIAVRGVPTAHVLIGVPSPVDVTLNGKKLRRGYKVWPVASNLAKSELYGWLALKPPTKEDREAGEVDPPGFCRFPEHGEEYFKQLTAEQLVPHRNHRGYVTMVWDMIPGRENHFLDARVYARAAAAVVGLDRFAESDWESLERSLGLVSPQQSLPLNETAVVEEPEPFRAGAPPAAPPPTTHTDRSSWLRPKGSSWLKGNR